MNKNITKKEMVEMIVKAENDCFKVLQDVKRKLNPEDKDLLEVKNTWMVLFALEDALVNGDTANLENKLDRIKSIQKIA